MHRQTPPSGQSGHRKDVNKQQQKYVPKTSDYSEKEKEGRRSSNKARNGLLTGSLRQSNDKEKGPVNCKPGEKDNKDDSQSSNKQVGWGNGEKGKLLKEGRFVRYLPQDDAVAAGLGAEQGGLDPEESQTVADLLNQELSLLLRMKPRDFWRTVSTDDSLCEFLDSYLQFRRRWYDLPHCSQPGSMAGLVVGDQELSQRVFMVLYRMSSNQDPGAPARESLSSKEHADLLLGKSLLDVPKLMDISAIFGHDNLELTQSLVFNALKSQPGLADELKGVVPRFLDIVDMMYHRCLSSIEVLPVSRDNGTLAVRQLHEDLLEVLDFLNDGVSTLNAFVEAYAPAAAVFISSGVSNEGNKELLPMLACMHDSLLPLLERGLVLTTENANNSDSNDFGVSVQLCLKTLCARIIKFAWQLLCSCYLSQNMDWDNSYCASSKVFPAQVEDPGVRGDIIIQVIGDIAGGSSISVDGCSSSGAFLGNLNKRHKLMNNIDELCQNEWIHLNNAQLDYISQLVGHSESKTLIENSITERADISSLALEDKNSSKEEIVIFQSKISQIKDIFSDYGDGFLSACLDVYNDNPEEVIQHILEGTLHPDLLSLDTTLQVKTSNKQTSLERNDKGKGILDESAFLAREEPRLNGSYSQKIISSSSSSGESMKPSLSPVMKFSSAGRYVRRSKDDENVANILDQHDVKDSFRSAILASQYEDEYDDSFDELGTGVLDSRIEEIDSLEYRISSEPAQRWSAQSTKDEVGSSRKVNNSSDDSTSQENSVNVSHKKIDSKVCHTGLGGSAPSLQRTTHGSYGRGKKMEKEKTQFYVKDGKNYSYKVAGAVAVSSVEEAEALKKVEEETIYGLGPGGNIPSIQMESLSGAATDNIYGNRATRGGSQRGRGGNRRGGVQGDKVAYVRKSSDNHRRKDQAMKKHFSGLGGY